MNSYFYIFVGGYLTKYPCFIHFRNQRLKIRNVVGLFTSSLSSLVKYLLPAEMKVIWMWQLTSQGRNHWVKNQFPYSALSRYFRCSIITRTRMHSIYGVKVSSKGNGRKTNASTRIKMFKIFSPHLSTLRIFYAYRGAAQSRHLIFVLL